MDTIEYIDSYFQQTMETSERRVFEKRCEDDEAFAQQVAFYITTRQSLLEELLQQKKSVWKTKNILDELPFIPTLKKSFASRWITYAAAACLILAASVYFFEANTSPKKLAQTYIRTNYASLSQTMDASHDSLQSGIEAYNNKNYAKALQFFLDVQKTDPSNSDAKKYAGLAYLQQKYYDSALHEFDELAAMKGLFGNPGDFLKAVTLIERGKPGDKEVAEKLLEKVVTKKEEGSDKAAEWQKKL
jgi:tetratricopeptide (TPR) repeat protein